MRRLEANVVPFSYGLSYTTFSFSDLTLSSPTQQGPNFNLYVSVTVTNTGSIVGSEVVQVYISLPDFGLTTPRLQLRGFAKTHGIAPGQSKMVTVKLDKYAVSWWDTLGQQWKVVRGTYGVHVGKSSADIILQGEFAIQEGFVWVGL